MKWLRESISHHARTWIGARGRHILHGSAWALVARLAGAANLLLSIPLVLNAVGTASFGFWATMVSLALLGSSLDFGLGNGAMNLVAGARGRNANHEIPNVIAAARGPMILAGLAIGGAVGLAGVLLPWTAAPQLAAIPGEELRASVLILAVAITLAVPLSLATKALMGLGDAAIAFKWQAAAQLLTLLLTAVLAVSGAGLVSLVSAAVLGPLAGSILQAIVLSNRLPKSSLQGQPGIRRQIYSSGLLFFGIQLCAMAAFGLDLVIITAFATPEETASYATVQRVFQLVPLSLAMLWAPLWPVYRHALASNDHNWSRATLKRSAAGAVFFAAAFGVALAFSISFAHQHNAIPGIHLTLGLLAGFVLWTTIEAFGTAVATFLNALEALRIQLFLGISFATSCIAAKYFAVTTIGPELMPWATAICYAATVLLPLGIWWVKNRPIAPIARRPE
jgi:O-antigen/teichoic acid export membrane protein